MQLLVFLFIAIKQPELQLHPAMQAKRAKALIAGIRRVHDNGRQLQLLLEIHSQTIVNFISDQQLHRDVWRGRSCLSFRYLYFFVLFDLN